MDKVKPIELPELPEGGWCNGCRLDGDGFYYYTADQMRAYAEQSIEFMRAEAFERDCLLKAALDAAGRMIARECELVLLMESLRTDAARYQWLRVNEMDRTHVFMAASFDSLDADIDAAIRRAGECESK